mgnify:CR=1 FL=1
MPPQKSCGRPPLGGACATIPCDREGSALGVARPTRQRSSLPLVYRAHGHKSERPQTGRRVTNRIDYGALRPQYRIADRLSRRAGRRFDLTQDLLISVVIEAHDGDLPDPHRGRSEISGRTEHLLGHFRNLGILHLEDIELLALGDIDLRRGLGDRASLLRR